jgi:hypothetical protein
LKKLVIEKCIFRIFNQNSVFGKHLKLISVEPFVQKCQVFAILQHGMDAAILQIVGDSNLCDF